MVDKRLRPDISSRLKIIKSSCYFYEFHNAIFYDDYFCHNPCPLVF